MVKHIVLWKLKDDVQGEKLKETVKLLREKFAALIGVVDGLVEIELGENYNGGDFNLVLYSVFNSVEGEKAYQNHPSHLEIKAIIQTIVEDRAAVDYMQ